MSDNRLRCPACDKSLGGLTREGDVRVRLAITLVKADGTVHGPCSACGADLVLVRDGTLVEALDKAFEPPEVIVRGRLVLALRDLGG